MAFNSLVFWIVFPIIFLVYWTIPGQWNTWRKVFLVLVSYILYMNWNPAFALVLFGVTIVTYCGGRLLGNCGNPEMKKRRNLLVWMFAFLGLFPLLLFKYYNFLNDSISTGLGHLGLRISLSGLNWAIPVGISFFTFQAVGYMLDVYHGRTTVESSFLDYLLFVSFFPQVASGPISTSEELMPQIKAIHHFEYKQGVQGLKWLLWGMFIKLVVADRLGLFVDTVYNNYPNYNGTACLVASLFYTIQIYCDFAGYSLMAIGIAATLGFDLINNFRRPYFALSITDFWKRWHISLTRWLTRQVYIPLGGNRCSKSRNYLNIMITFLVSGVWHGANWTFVLWGAIHGILQINEKFFGIAKYSGNNRCVKAIRIFVVFLLVNFAWIFFRMPSIGDAFTFIKKIFTEPGFFDIRSGFGTAAGVVLAILGLVILAFKDIREEFFPKKMQWLNAPIVRWACYVALFCMIVTIGVLDSSQFIYVSF